MATPSDSPSCEPPDQPNDNELNPILQRVLAEVQKASEIGKAHASNHSVYVSGVFEREE